MRVKLAPFFDLNFFVKSRPKLVKHSWAGGKILQKVTLLHNSCRPISRFDIHEVFPMKMPLYSNLTLVIDFWISQEILSYIIVTHCSIYTYYHETTLYYDHQHWITFELRGIHAYNEMARIVERIHRWKGSKLQFSDLFQQRWECWSMLLKALFELKTNLD